MASLREIKARIITVGSTLKITSAMSMISSVKLHKAQQALTRAATYENTLSKILAATYEDKSKAFNSEEIKEKRKVNSVVLVVISSNTSLCGAFNSNTEKMVLKVAEDYSKEGIKKITIFAIGKIVSKHLKNRVEWLEVLPDRIAEKPSSEEILNLSERLRDLHKRGEADIVEFVYNHFISTGHQTIIREKYLPHTYTDSSLKDSDRYIYEPGIYEIREELVRKCLLAKLTLILADSRASEHAARTVAMQMATENARKLMYELTLQYNKGRQQAITNELLDIMGGYSTR
jgi:F-type H+-transporting ATPase subunit gamma